MFLAGEVSVSAWLRRFEVKLGAGGFVSGHDFSRAEKTLLNCHPERSGGAAQSRDLLFARSGFTARKQQILRFAQDDNS